MHLHITQVSLNLYFLKKSSFLYNMKKYFNQDFPKLNLTKNTKTMTSNCLYPYGVLCWTCRSRRSTSLPLRTKSSGVLLSSFIKLTSAPLSINIRTASVLLLSRAAQCNGVSLLYRVCLFTFAPSSSRCLMTSVSLNLDARWRAVEPSLSLTSTGIPSLIIRSIVVTSPLTAALRKLTTSSQSVSRYEKRLYAN